MNMDAVIDEVVSIAVEHRMVTEAERRLAPVVVDAVVEHRLCRLALPAELGGHGLALVEFMHVLERLAGAEASLPWLVWNNAQVCLFSRFFAPEMRETLFSDPTELFAISAIPAGEAVAGSDGYRVTGRWPLVSGCELAEWLVMNCRVSDPDSHGAPASDWVVVHCADVQIIDTWDTGGMRGTGSHDVVIDDVAVDRSATLLWSEFPPPGDAVIDRVPITATLAAGLGAQMLGVAVAALGTVTERARTVITNGPSPDLRDRPRAQEAIGRHGAAVDAARNWLYDRCALVWRRAEAGQPCTPGEVADLYAAALHAMTIATDAVDEACATAGTSSIYTSSPLERAHRDIHVMARHRLAGVPLLEDVGRIRFGLQPADPMFTI